MAFEIQTPNKTLSISEVDRDGDIEIEIENLWGDTIYMYLKQDKIKELRDFLTAQIKED